MDDIEKAARYTLATKFRISPIKFKEILEHYSSITKYCSTFNVTIEYPNEIFKNICWVYGEANYPKLLEQINDPPILLYHKGSVNSVPNKCVAIVGTRNPTEYGVRVAREVAENYIQRGYTIVSGLAFGIDAIVHEVCISNKAKTIAVLGGDLNCPYPKSNASLYSKIIASGMLISESFTPQPFSKFIFAKRNRIIAGLVEQVVVIEAPIKSGALITVNYANQYNREVIAVPGNIYQEKSAGCNSLIFNNKAIIYMGNQSNINIFTDLPEGDMEIIKLITAGTNTIDDIQQKVYISRPELISKLSNMELAGIIAKDFYDSYIVLVKK